MDASSTTSTAMRAQQQHQKPLHSAMQQAAPTPRLCDPMLLSMAFDALSAPATGEDDPVSPLEVHQSLTKESLLLLNRSNEEKQQEQVQLSPHLLEPVVDSDFTTTPELTSSSSSLASFDEASKDRQQLQIVYNNSSSSVATIVQRLASSNSTLDLQVSNDNTSNNLENKYQYVKDISTTSLSSLNSNNDTESTTTEVTMGKPRRLKSSLKLPGLHRSRSLPSVAKTVRFSNDLTKVKTFSEHARPSSISLSNSPESALDSGVDDYDDEDYFNPPPKAFFDLKSSSLLNTSSSDSDSDDDYFAYKSKLRQSSWKLQANNYDFYTLQHRPQLVKLTSLAIRGTELVGSVQVRNMTFEKFVEIKFTTDGWNSIYLITAEHSRCLDSMNDQFNFHIDLNNSIMMNSKRMQRKNSSQPISVELCVKYISNGSDVFYDNNAGQNYSFQLVSTLKNSKKRKSSMKSSKNSSYIDANFVAAKISSPPKVLTSGRYFSDDTDYFNDSSDRFKWYEPSAVSTPSVSPSLKSSSNTLQETLSKTPLSLPSKALPSKISQQDTVPTLKKNESYSDFLQKYCFFKSDDHHGLDAKDSVFIR